MCFCNPNINAPYCDNCQHIYEAVKLSNLPDNDFNKLIHMIGDRHIPKSNEKTNLWILGISMGILCLIFFLFI